MTWWGIVLLCAACLTALVTAVFSLKVGAALKASGEGVRFALLAGPWQLDPEKLKKKKKPAPVKPEQEPKQEPTKKPEGQSLLQSVKPVLSFFLPRLRIDNFLVTYRIGGREDPFGASLRYGEAQAVYGALVSGLENLCIVKNRELKCGVDYDSDRSEASLELKITVRVWDAIRYVLTAQNQKP